MARTATFAALFLITFSAWAWNRGEAARFATLPEGSAHPEGIAVDRAGNVYVADFDVSRGGKEGQIVVFDPDGRLLRIVDVNGSTNLLLGVDLRRDGREARDVELLVIDFGGDKLFSVEPFQNTSSVFASIPDASGLNALAFDKAGNVYVSDSFQGVVWKTGPSGGTAQRWVESPLLTTTGVPPFGANGLAFNKERDALFVANTGNDTVVRIPVDKKGNPGAPAVFVNSINGADGLAIDEEDNVWVVANQADEIVVVDSTGRAIAKLGDFDGLSSDGAPIGLLFPASLAFHGDQVYVTNLSLDLRLFNPDFVAVDSQWAAAVKRHTVARLSRRLR